MTYKEYLKGFIGEKFSFSGVVEGTACLIATAPGKDYSHRMFSFSEVHEDFVVVTSDTDGRKTAIPFYLLSIVTK